MRIHWILQQADMDVLFVEVSLWLNAWIIFIRRLGVRRIIAMYQLTGSEVWSGGIPGSDPKPPLDRSVQGPWIDPLEREGVGK